MTLIYKNGFVSLVVSHDSEKRGTDAQRALPTGMTWKKFDELVHSVVIDLYTIMRLSGKYNAITLKEICEEMKARHKFKNKTIRLCVYASIRHMIHDKIFFDCFSIGENRIVIRMV